MNTILGKNSIGYTLSAKGSKSFKGFNPTEGTILEEEFYYATADEIEEIMQLAASASKVYRKKAAEEIAVFLDAIADEILALGDKLVQRCVAESGLPEGRIIGERGRTMAQLKLFAETLRSGSYVEARIDEANPGRQPLPKPDLRRMLRPIGPVLVFGASNFPLAFSTAGGDTASALAAGCPVIVKAHSSHPGTNDLIAQAILKAAKNTGMPDGVFSLFYSDRNLTMKAVEHPVIKAIGFTGSRQAGMSIFKTAMNRPEPIPVFAEMSSINPVVILPGAISEKLEAIVNGLSASITNGVGQFCTNPGVVFLLKSEGTDTFLQSLADKVSSISPATMLNENICSAYKKGIEKLNSTSEVKRIAGAAPTVLNGKTQGTPALYVVSADTFEKESFLKEEVFGPSSLMILCDDLAQIERLISQMEGQLTATIHASEQEISSLDNLVDIMEDKAGRLLFGDFPTGVEVCASQQHGGPFPASSDSRFTSVGTAAILRFLRPVAYQSFPEALLPQALKNGNPLHLTRLINNQYSDK